MKWKDILKKVALTILNLFILSIVISYAFSSIKVINGEKFLPTIFNYTGVIVESGSMYPYAEVGDYLIIRETNAKKVKVGDVVTFADNSVFVTHRVKEIINDNGKIQFITQGDSNNVLDDEPLYGNNVVGKSVFVVPRVGTVINFISSKIILLIGALVVFIILSLVHKDKKKLRT